MFFEILNLGLSFWAAFFRAPKHGAILTIRKCPLIQIDVIWGKQLKNRFFQTFPKCRGSADMKIQIWKSRFGPGIESENGTILCKTWKSRSKTEYQNPKIICFYLLKPTKITVFWRCLNLRTSFWAAFSRASKHGAIFALRKLSLGSNWRDLTFFLDIFKMSRWVFLANFEYLLSSVAQLSFNFRFSININLYIFSTEARRTRTRSRVKQATESTGALTVSLKNLVYTVLVTFLCWPWKNIFVIFTGHLALQSRTPISHFPQRILLLTFHCPCDLLDPGRSFHSLFWSWSLETTDF